MRPVIFNEMLKDAFLYADSLSEKFYLAKHP